MDRPQFEATLAYLGACENLSELRRIAAKAAKLRDTTQDPDPDAPVRLNAVCAAARLRVARLCTVAEWIADYEAAEAAGGKHA